MPSKYKDAQGRFLTKALFKETTTLEMRAKFSPEFTLKEDDIPGYKSMRSIYIKMEDPTEYAFAIEVLGSWEHWLKLVNSGWFKEHIDAWRSELDFKLKSRGYKQMNKLAEDGNKDAARWLAEGKYNNKPTKRGRPSKEEVQGELKTQAKYKTDVAADAERLGIKLVK